MSPRRAKMATNSASQQARPQAKPICSVSGRLDKAVTSWAANHNRAPQLIAAMRALSAEIISLGAQDASMLLDQHAIRTVRQRVANSPSDNFSPEDVDRVASIFSSTILQTLA